MQATDRRTRRVPHFRYVSTRGRIVSGIKLRTGSPLNPLAISLLLISAIGTIGGGGYFLARTHLIDPSTLTFGTGANRQVATAATSYAAPQHQNSDTQPPVQTTSQQPPQASTNVHQHPATYSKNVKSPEFHPQEPSTQNPDTVSQNVNPASNSATYLQDVKRQSQPPPPTASSTTAR